MTNDKPILRCAIYTRKSTDEGLEQEFNSLDAQREAGEAYILSQRHAGWTLVPERYDDGGYSGGNMERPALKRLMHDIKAGKIDTVIVYKIDRISRSLLDFLKLMEKFDQANVTFVSVTQQFSTNNSMGRLILNILLSFAQFERETTIERVKDKIAASKSKGMWMGGMPPLGYDNIDKKLVINPDEAKIVKELFESFIRRKSVTMVAEIARSKGYRCKSHTSAKGNHHQGSLMTKGYIYKMISNPVYRGLVAHKDKIYKGQHEALISEATWQKVQDTLKVSPKERSGHSRYKDGSCLRGVIKCAGCNCGMTPTGTYRHGKIYRYYTPYAQMQKTCTTCPVGSISALEIEHLVTLQLQATILEPDNLLQTWQSVAADSPKIDMLAVKDILEGFKESWKNLVPSEQEHLIKETVSEIQVMPDSIDVLMFPDAGLKIFQELSARKEAA